ncbi:hypothetical protein P3TCK_20005 [Photobacterium profundum 3TCK]|uniref:Uncharacterized protein n=1 Tax=Photobacterium profundum 3TCK TaxID=314280 RepID=Q1Z9F5_9GAMM|nr:hypothetical protein P3TCK_20005 [Photobacterium profundum 3TCK]
MNPTVKSIGISVVGVVIGAYTLKFLRKKGWL